MENSFNKDDQAAVSLITFSVVATLQIALGNMQEEVIAVIKKTVCSELTININKKQKTPNFLGDNLW